MNYTDIERAIFIERPNRFIAKIKMDTLKACHVRNTGRMKELLTRGCEVFVQRNSSPLRKTDYTLIAVKREGRIFNVDSLAPNKLYKEYLTQNNIQHKAEVKYLSSRFDFMEDGGYTEVKGVTLDINGYATFPDAPTERGVRHLKELTRLAQGSVKAKVVFIAAYEGAEYFTPNKKTHPEFARALLEASENGVEIKAYTCRVEADSIEIAKEIPILL